jgi:hypothetical protein
MTQAVEYLRSKCKALSSNPSTTITTKKKKKIKEFFSFFVLDNENYLN